MPSRRLAWLVAIAGSLTMTVSYVDRTTLGVLAPTVTQALHISETAYGVLSSAFSVAYLVAVPISGWWIDYAGARRGLVASVLIWSGIAAAHALAPGFGVLLALRIALGVAEGPSFPGAAQTVSRILPPADRSRGFGILFTGSSVGSMLAPPIASALYAHLGWRLAFLGTTAVGLLWLPLWIVLTRSAGVRAVLDTDAAASPEKRPALGQILWNSAMLRALAGILAVAPVLGFAAVWGAKYLVRVHSVPQAAVGNYLWLPPLVADLAAVLFGDLAARQSRGGAPPRALHAVAVLLTASTVGLLWTSTPWQVTACFCASWAGGIAVYTLVTSDLLARMPPARASFAAGILTGAQSLALIVAHPLIGHAVDAYGGYKVPVVALAVWVFPGSLVWWAWRPSPASPSAIAKPATV
jgi:ACS family hexuronate transporter-like MFS transporter